MSALARPDGIMLLCGGGGGSGVETRRGLMDVFIFFYGLSVSGAADEAPYNGTVGKRNFLYCPYRAHFPNDIRPRRCWLPPGRSHGAVTRGTHAIGKGMRRDGDA